MLLKSNIYSSQGDTSFNILALFMGKPSLGHKIKDIERICWLVVVVKEWGVRVWMDILTIMELW